jgi:hypothetical protein
VRRKKSEEAQRHLPGPMAEKRGAPRSKVRVQPVQLVQGRKVRDWVLRSLGQRSQHRQRVSGEKESGCTGAASAKHRAHGG